MSLPRSFSHFFNFNKTRIGGHRIFPSTSKLGMSIRYFIVPSLPHSPCCTQNLFSYKLILVDCLLWWWLFVCFLEKELTPTKAACFIKYL